MNRRTSGVVLVSALLHGALWLAVLGVERPPPPPPPPIKITVRDVPAPPPPEPPPPAPAPKKPRPEPAPKPAAAPTPAPASDAPDFGVQLGNGGDGPGGLSIPTGDPGGAPGGGKPREKVEAKKRTLEAKPKRADDGCSEELVKPKPLELPQPQYTEAARAAAIQGKVRVQLTVATDGAVRDAKVVSSLDPGLDAAALAAVKAAKFAPATRCGAPVEHTITISIKFSL